MMINFWKDPNAESCCICGEEVAEEKHDELTCPCNYLSPDSYVPCRARSAAWNSDRNVASSHGSFLRRFVRVTNLPARCRPAHLAAIFARFGLLTQDCRRSGPLRMWHVAMDTPELCKGFASVVFERREDAEKAMDELNCSCFDSRSFRVDWFYPSA